MLKIYITNLGKYTEGELVGAWLELPATEIKIAETLELIQIDGIRYEETIITDYACDVDGVEIGEYDSLDLLNELAERLEAVDDPEILCALLAEGYDLDKALNVVGDCLMWYGCHDMTDVAYDYCEELGILDSIPDNLRGYFDYEAFGRDLSYEGRFVAISSGILEICA